MMAFILSWSLCVQDPLERLKEVRDHVFADRYDEALTVLDEVRAKTGPNVMVDELRATVLNRLGRHVEADEVATDVIAREPDSADAHFERGLSRLERGLPKEAKEDLELAIQLGYRAPPLAQMELARAEAMLGNMGRAQDLLAQVLEGLDDSTDAYGAIQRWRAYLSDLTARKADEPYGLKLSMGSGWTSNALRLDEDVAGVSGVGGRRSMYFAGRLQGFYNFVHEAETRVGISAAPEYRWYERANGVSYLTTPVRLDAGHLFGGFLVGRLGLKYQPAWLFAPDRRLNTTWAVEPSVTVPLATWARATLGGEVGWTKYALGGLAGARDPDSTYWGISLSPSVDLDDDRTLTFFSSIGYKENEADGSDYDTSSLQAGVGLEWKATEDFRIAGGVQLLWSWYDHVHSLSPTADRRRDFLVLPYLAATYDVNEWFSITATASRLNAESTVELFDYTATDVSLMFGFDLLALAKEAGEDEE